MNLLKQFEDKINYQLAGKVLQLAEDPDKISALDSQLNKVFYTLLSLTKEPDDGYYTIIATLLFPFNDFWNEKADNAPYNLLINGRQSNYQRIKLGNGLVVMAITLEEQLYFEYPNPLENIEINKKLVVGEN